MHLLYGAADAADNNTTWRMRNAPPRQAGTTSECRQNRNSVRKKKWKRKLPKSFYSSIHTHRQTKEASFCIPYSIRASFTSCAAYAGDLALGLCGIPYKASTSCASPTISSTHCFRCAEACFITFWLSLLQICAKLLQVVCQVWLTRKLWDLSRGAEGARGPITKPTAMCNIYLKLISVAQLDCAA